MEGGGPSHISGTLLMEVLPTNQGGVDEQTHTSRYIRVQVLVRVYSSLPITSSKECVSILYRSLKLLMQALLLLFVTDWY